MNVPSAVEAALGGEDVAARVPLKGEDALFVTPTRTLVYRAEGLLSDESVAEYPHGAERIEVEEGRRKATVALDYGLDGRKELTVPAGKLDDALHPILAGVLNASGVTGPGETVTRTYRFSELTLVVTSDRLVKHVGAAVWDEDHEELAFADVTGVDAEEGSVAGTLVLETDGRTQRIKAPNESFRDVRETVEEALFAFHGVGSAEAFRRAVAGDAGQDREDARADAAFRESDIDPIETSVGEGSEGGDGETGGDAGEAGETREGADAADSTGTAGAPDPDGIRLTGSEATEAERAEAEWRSAARRGEGPGDGAPEAGGASAESERDAETGAESRAETRGREETGTQASGGRERRTEAATRDATGSERGADAETEPGPAAGDSGPGAEPSLDRELLRAELSDLREAVERQAELLDEHRETVERQREVIDRQREALERQHDQIEALLDVTRDR